MTEYFTITDCVPQLQHSLLILVRSNLNLATRLTGFIFILPVVTLHWQRGQSPPPLKIFSLCEVTKSLCCKGVQSPLAGETETRWQESHSLHLIFKDKRWHLRKEILTNILTNHVKLVIVFLSSFSYHRNKARQQKTAALHDAAC